MSSNHDGDVYEVNVSTPRIEYTSRMDLQNVNIV